MAQNYTDIQPSELISNSLSMLLSNFETIMSNSSGAAFPTANLQNGMWFFNSATNKMYLLLDKNVPTWSLVFDFTNPLLFPFMAGVLALKQDKIESSGPAASAISNLLNSVLAANKAVVSDGAGKIVAAAVSAAEVGSLAGVSQNVQMQFGNKQNKITVSAMMPSGGVDGDIWLQVE